MSNKEHFIQQAHHIIPVEALEEYEDKIQKLFGLGDIKDFQQMGSNFIYLYSETKGKHEYADKDPPKGSLNVFGDVSMGIKSVKMTDFWFMLRGNQRISHQMPSCSQRHFLPC